MSKINETAGAASQNVPLFARLLQSSTVQSTSGGPVSQPTYHCLDSECTKKYPSDDDEVTSTLWDK